MIIVSKRRFVIAVTGLCFLLAALASTFGCVTPKEKKQITNDLFIMQTRMLELERQLSEKNENLLDKDTAASKKIASTSTELDKINIELQKIMGELDRLRVGVVTGQLPGADPQQEGSIAATMTDLTSRIEAIETSQQDLLAAIEKAGLKKATKKRRGSSNVKELQADFDQKRFKYVVEDAPRLLKKVSKSDKPQVSFLFAESLYKLGKLRDAALKYNDLIESKPSHKFLPRAKMRMGDCFRHLGDKVTAKLYYDELITEFPESDEAVKAKELLGSMEGRGA